MTVKPETIYDRLEELLMADDSRDGRILMYALMGEIRDLLAVCKALEVWQHTSDGIPVVVEDILPMAEAAVARSEPA